MKFGKYIKNVQDYFDKTLQAHGTTPKGVDWNNEETREARFQQLLRIIKNPSGFSILDYGCGYGALIEYLQHSRYHFTQFIGYDISPSMINAAKNIYHDVSGVSFTTRLNEIPAVDYATACGVFNMKLEASHESWTDFVLQSLHEMNDHSHLGFSVNFLTQYSDPDRMRWDLYYADPCFLFDYCKRHFSKNVALLHDYGLYDFTILVRKNV